MKNKIIFFAPILEYPPKGGPQLSVINAIKSLNKACDLHIVTSVNENFHDVNALNFIHNHSKSFRYSPSSKIFTKDILSIKHMTKLKRIFSPFISVLDAIFILKTSKKNNINIFWIDRVIEHAFFVFWSLGIFKRDIKLIGDTETIYSDFILRELPFIKNPLRFIYIFLRGYFARFQEFLMTRRADAITAVSSLDKQHYLERVNNPSKVLLFSNVVDIEDYAKERPINDEVSKPYIILMGSFGHQNSPMDRAAKWLVKDIMPLVWKDCPNLNVCIVGRNSDVTQSSLSSNKVRVLGKVPYIFPYLKNASISLVPLIYESGTRFKIIETGAVSIPCISTTLGAEGLDVTNGTNILIADTTEEFASAIIRVMKNEKLSKTLSSELHNLVKKKYSLDKQTKEAKYIIDFINGDRDE